MDGALTPMPAAAAAPTAPPRPLPALRQELRLERGADGVTGAPTWLVVDPVANTYTQIDETAFQLLSVWGTAATAVDLATAAAATFGLSVSPAQVEELARFLDARHLVVAPRQNGWRHFAEAARRREQGWLGWAVHNYLFVRVPLVRPQRFLDRTLPLTAIFYSRGFWLAIAATGLAGLYLVSRQWEAFKSTFLHLFSWEGLAVYGLALVAVKALHELGHAYTATRYGCRVPSMGVTLMVLVPMLYTDVTDSWRLRSRRQRMIIDAAGMVVELAIACVATALWAFLPDGPMRSAAFTLATIGWVMSLAVNLNPLMRFDGYYLLSDLIGVDNLQERAFAIGRWRMREILFGLGAAPPERLPRRLERFLAVYAWAVWLYRLVLFTGIALMVYHLTFKVLGVVLFAIEIVYFVLRPIADEAAWWWREGRTIRARPRARLTAALAASIGVAVAVPWSTRVELPAVAEAAELTRTYPPRAAEVTALHVAAGQRVAAGDPIATLRAPALEHEATLVARRLALVDMRLARRGADDEDRSRSLTLERERALLHARREGLRREAAELVVRAPHAGEVAEINPEVHPGRHVAQSDAIALVRGHARTIVRGYLGEHDLGRIGDGARGLFAPDDPLLPRAAVELASVSRAAAFSIEILELASRHGGPLAVRPQHVTGGPERLAPETASYLTVFEIAEGNFASGKAERGVILVEGRAESLLARVWRQALKVLVRESGL